MRLIFGRSGSRAAVMIAYRWQYVLVATARTFLRTPHQRPLFWDFQHYATIGLQRCIMRSPASRGQIARIDGNGASFMAPGSTVRPW
jgi:hypothetical protein